MCTSVDIILWKCASSSSVFQLNHSFASWVLQCFCLSDSSFEKKPNEQKYDLLTLDHSVSHSMRWFSTAVGRNGISISKSLSVSSVTRSYTVHLSPGFAPCEQRAYHFVLSLFFSLFSHTICFVDGVISFFFIPPSYWGFCYWSEMYFCSAGLDKHYLCALRLWSRFR